MKNQKNRIRPNYHKANWARFQKIIMEFFTELAAEKVPSKKLLIFTEALKKAASMTTPLRVFRTNETPHMNDEIKCLKKERNRLSQPGLEPHSMVEESKEVAEKVEKEERLSSRNNLERINVKKDARLA